MSAERGDYYLTPDGQLTETPGQWVSDVETLERLRIDGEAPVVGSQFIALMEGRDPDTGRWLRPPGADGSRGGGIARSGSRVRTVVNAIRSLYSWAQDRELVDHNPASRVRLPAMNATPRGRVASVPEMKRLLAALEPCDALPYALAVYATARRGEIRHARVGDVDLDLGVIYLGADEAGRKSRAAQRAVPLVKPLRTLVRKELLRRGRPGREELLCPGAKPGGGNSGMLSVEALQARCDRTWEPRDKDGKPTGPAIAQRITLHECRHTCASWLDAAGVRPIVVSQLMGHAAPAHQPGAARITQERYTHALPGELEDALRSFDKWLANATGRIEGVRAADHRS